jgi:hypothetical protein
MKSMDKTHLEARDSYRINVLLAYDNTHTRGAILGMLDRISTQLRDKTLFKINAFSFGLLEQIDPRLCASAGTESAEVAEIAVVAFGKEGAPGAGLLRWLENWAERHAGQDAALGLQPLAPLSGKSVRRVVRALREIAARHGLRFIYGAADRLALPQTACTAVA